MLDRLKESLWERNTALYRMLGLCPLLAVSTSIENALALASASLFVLLFSSIIVNLLKALVVHHARLPFFVLVVATLTTAASLCVEAFAWTIYMEVALYLQIVVTNCMILGHLERTASREPFGPSLLDALGTAAGFAIALLAVAAIRQSLGLFFPLAVHPSGAFIIFGLLVAFFRYLTGESRETNPDVRAVARTQSSSDHRA